MDANMLINRIIEKDLSVMEMLEICDKLCEPNRMTIGDAIYIKNTLGLSNLEAIELFFTLEVVA